jgi:hypothetical protein
MAHNLTAVPVFAGLPAAALASGWRSWRAGQHRFGLYSAGTVVTMLTTAALAGAGFGQSPRLVNLGGLFQRASIITASPGSPPCPHKRSGERPLPQHHATRQAAFPRPPDMRREGIFGSSRWRGLRSPLAR